MGKGESIRVRSPAADRGAVEVAAGWGMRVPPQGPPSQLESLGLYPKGTGAPVRGFQWSRNRWDLHYRGSSCGGVDYRWRDRTGGWEARDSGGILGQRSWGHTQRRAWGAKAQASGRLRTVLSLRQDTGGSKETHFLIMKHLCETPRESLHCGCVEGEVSSVRAIHQTQWDDSRTCSWGLLQH